MPAPAAISQEVTSVPESTLNAVGAGSISRPQVFNVYKLDHPLTKRGKPELITMNLAWCPHCAANNWALAIALSRFGTLSNLRIINSGIHYCKLSHQPCTLQAFPCFPYTHGLSFFDASYRSRYLRLVHIVLQDVHGHNLQRPNRAEIAALAPWDPFGQTPQVDVGGRYGFLNSGIDPGILMHKSWAQIAGTLANPRNGIAKHIDGLANLFTAAICKTTAGKPAAVCKSPGVKAAGSARLKNAPPPPPPPGAP